MRNSLGASADAETGSHASHEAPAGLRPTGFDPARIYNMPERLFARSLENMDGMSPELFNDVQDAAVLLAELREAITGEAWEALYVLKLLVARCDRHGSSVVMLDVEDARAIIAAIAMEAAKPDRPRSGLDPKGDSAGPKDIAQEKSA